jgi:DNA-directed RNA polymerase II subunit RPB2
LNIHPVIRYASPLYVDMSKRTQIATPHDPNNPNRNPNDLFQDENGSERPPMTKVFIGKVMLLTIYSLNIFGWGY